MKAIDWELSKTNVTSQAETKNTILIIFQDNNQSTLKERPAKVNSIVRIMIRIVRIMNRIVWIMNGFVRIMIRIVKIMIRIFLFVYIT